MTRLSADLTQRERELGAIISAYNDVTEQLRGAHERLLAEVARLRDELARKNRQLRRRERLAALGELAAGVAHEIRNPLGGIQLFASLLEKDVADRPNALRLTGKIIKGVGTLESIVTDILHFARPTEPAPAPVEVGRVVHEAIELATARSERQGVQVKIAGQIENLSLHTDGALLGRALLNLLLNAIDAAGDAADGLEAGRTPAPDARQEVQSGPRAQARGGGRGALEPSSAFRDGDSARAYEHACPSEGPGAERSARRPAVIDAADGRDGCGRRIQGGQDARPPGGDARLPGSDARSLESNACSSGGDARSPLVVVSARAGTAGRVVISVADNGPGIPAELMDRIFNPFFTTKGAGTGLGLAIVHQIAELLGGTVQAANRREGGAVFSLCLPRRLERSDQCPDANAQ